MAGLLRQRLPADGVLRQADRHAEGGEAEADVEAPLLLQQPGQQRTEQGTDVDAHVEDREPGVAAFVVLVVERADQRRGGRLEATAAERDQDQADADPGEAGDQRQRDVTGHHHDGAGEQRPLRAQHPVRQPGSEDGREVDAAAVGADDARGGPLVHAEAAVGHGVVQVDQQDPLHAVEGEPLPHLDAEEVGEDAGLTEEGLLGGLLARGLRTLGTRGRVSHVVRPCQRDCQRQNPEAVSITTRVVSLTRSRQRSATGQQGDR